MRSRPARHEIETQHKYSCHAEWSHMSGPPKVFVSYSHESADHIGWVTDLSTALRKNGIDIILDRWDVRLGQDFTKFMERSVNDADRVLVICTDTYNAKADQGIGGVGYEKGIVSAEILAHSTTTKFVPVVRSV